MVQRIRERYTPEAFDRVVEQYILALDGLMDVQGAETRQQYEARIEAVVEEVLADAYAGMNMWNAGATQFSETVREFMEENNISRKPGAENGVRETNGPPADGQKENTAGYGGERYSINEKFYEQIDKWDKKTIGFSFVVGETSFALQKAGIPKKQIRWDASKIFKLLTKHNGMSIDIVKQIPGLLESPIIVIDSKKNSNSKIIMGDVYDDHGKVVTTVLLLTPTSKKGNVLDMLKISSAEGRSHISSLFKKENGDLVPIRYIILL